MSKKERKAAAARLEALLAAGDHRGARAEAQRLLAGGGAGAEREAASGALARIRPEPGAAVAAAVGAALYAAAALAGLLGHR